MSREKVNIVIEVCNKKNCMIDVFCRNFKSRIIQRWKQSSRILEKFLSVNSIWLAAELDLNEFSCCKKLRKETPHKFGRQKKSFEQSSAKVHTEDIYPSYMDRAPSSEARMLSPKYYHLRN